MIEYIQKGEMSTYNILEKLQENKKVLSGGSGSIELVISR
jgi:hypothetical protein